jgi:hypothetical protein
MMRGNDRGLNGGPSLQPLLVAAAFVSALLVLAGCGKPLANPGLRSLYPQQRMILFIDQPPAAFVPVYSLQPTLKWESFPDGRGLKKGSADIYKRIEDVSYELVLAEADAMHQVYRRKGLKEPMHIIETPLKPRTKYLWTVRACFRLDDEPRCAEWGAVSDWEHSTVWHPNIFSYRFRTP